MVGFRVLTVAEGVPELDGLVARPGEDLAVVNREGHREHVLGVANEAARGDAGVEVPEAEGAVPRAGERELPVRGDHHVLDVVGVAQEGAAGDTVRGGVIAGEVPHDEGLVARGGHEHVLGLRVRTAKGATNQGQCDLQACALHTRRWERSQSDCRALIPAPHGKRTAALSLPGPAPARQNPPTASPLRACAKKKQ